MVNSSVTFCVGGSFFTTLQDTLSREASSRLSFMARGTIPCTKDSQGVIFLDRDPKHFQALLNFLRDGWCLLPASPDERQELLHEVRHYQLGNMEAWIRSQGFIHGLPQQPSPSASLATRFASATISSTSPSAAPDHGYSPGFSTRGGQSASGDMAGAGQLYSPGFTTRGGQPTVAYTGGGPNRRALFPNPQPGPPPLPSQPLLQPHQVISNSLLDSESSDMASMGAASSMGAVSTPHGRVHGGGGESGRDDFRAAFVKATLSSPAPAPHPSYSIPPPPPAPAAPAVPDLYFSTIESSAGKWTGKYLRTHDGLREVANTLMELAFLPIHRSLHGGKVEIDIACKECRHHHPSSLLSKTTGIPSSSSSSRRELGDFSSLPLAVSVKSATGWSFDLDLSGGASGMKMVDPDLVRKYNIGGFVEENWFVLSAVLKDQFGVLMEERGGERPSCPACRRMHVSVTLNKIY